MEEEIDISSFKVPMTATGEGECHGVRFKEGDPIDARDGGTARELMKRKAATYMEATKKEASTEVPAGEVPLLETNVDPDPSVDPQ